jgi:ABC-type nitrate/sulfonate/bicarbonate transport system substrate-binding protein
LRAKSSNNAAVSTVIFGVVVVVVLVVAAAGGYFAGTSTKSSSQATVTNTITSTVTGSIATTSTTSGTVTSTPYVSSNTSFTIGVAHFSTPPTAPLAYINQNNNTILNQYLPNAKLEQFASGSTGILTAMESGSVQVGVTITDSALTAISKNVPITIVASWEASPVVQAMFANSNSSYTNLASLKGATFAVTGSTSLSGIVTKILAGQEGWTSTEYSMSPVGSPTAILAAVSQSKTTVGVLDPFVSALSSPNYKIVGLVNETWPEFSVVALNTFVAAHPNAIKAAIAMFSGVNTLFNTNPGGVAQKFMASYPLYNMTTAQYDYFMSTSHWSSDGTIHSLEYQSALTTLQNYGVITSNLTASQVYTNKFVSVVP